MSQTSGQSKKKAYQSYHVMCVKLKFVYNHTSYCLCIIFALLLVFHDFAIAIELPDMTIILLFTLYMRPTSFPKL